MKASRDLTPDKKQQRFEQPSKHCAAASEYDHQSKTWYFFTKEPPQAKAEAEQHADSHRQKKNGFHRNHTPCILN